MSDVRKKRYTNRAFKLGTYYTAGAHKTTKHFGRSECHNIDSKTLVSERIDTCGSGAITPNEDNQQYIGFMRPVFNRRKSLFIG